MKKYQETKQESPTKKPPVLLIFDTETTGLPSRDRKIRANPLSWPRLVQAGWILSTEDGKVIREEEYTVFPTGYDIPEEASIIHGITSESARKEGIAVEDVLRKFCCAVTEADILVAHNLAYDIRIILSELIRAGKRETLSKIPGACTMRSSAPYCAIVGTYGKGFRYPSLSFLYKKLYNSCPQEAHRALQDARTCAACYFELVNQGVKIETDSRIHQYFPDK